MKINIPPLINSLLAFCLLFSLTSCHDTILVHADKGWKPEAYNRDIKVLAIMPVFRNDAMVSYEIMESAHDYIQTQMGRINKIRPVNKYTAMQIARKSKSLPTGEPDIAYMLDYVLPYETEKFDLLVVTTLRNQKVDSGATYLADVTIIDLATKAEVYHGRSRLVWVKPGMTEAAFETTIAGAMFPLHYDLKKIGLAVANYVNPLGVKFKIVPGF